MEYNISTITLSTSTGVILNLYEIAKKLKIDNVILGLKYNNNKYSFFKGLYQNSLKTFNNQITLKVKYNDKTINVKTFQNGSFQMTGCKSVDDGYYLTEILLKKFKELVYDSDVPIFDMDCLRIDKKDNVYNKENLFIGYFCKEDNDYTINNKKYIYINEKEIFINKRRIKNEQEVLDVNGEILGYITYNFINNNKKFYSKNKGVVIDYINNKITYKKIGSTIQEKLLAKIEFYDKTTTIKNKITDIMVKTSCINIYTDFYKLIGNVAPSLKINREILKNKLLENGYNAIYNPEIYSGLKFIYKYSSTEKNTGKCICDDKCLCRNISFLIFQSGKIIISNFKSIDEINDILISFKQIIKSIE
jgi:TATA-box binding protein (TBP) (component of TFIID and TFIIIB)